MSVLKAFRYFMANPRYTILYRVGKPATVLQAITGQSSRGYESLRDELEQARHRALAPLRAAVAQCQEEQRQKTEAQRRKVQEQFKALIGSNHNGPVMSKPRQRAD